jgi:hypothetical protein
VHNFTKEFRVGDVDAINPAHYGARTANECIDAMPAHFREWAGRNVAVVPSLMKFEDVVKLMMIGFCVGNAFKYRWRKGRKDNADQDERKARWYDAFAQHLVDPRLPDPRTYRG